jgi:hypothetical protein
MNEKLIGKMFYYYQNFWIKKKYSGKMDDWMVEWRMPKPDVLICKIEDEDIS